MVFIASTVYATPVMVLVLGDTSNRRKTASASQDLCILQFRYIQQEVL